MLKEVTFYYSLLVSIVTPVIVATKNFIVSHWAVALLSLVTIYAILLESVILNMAYIYILNFILLFN